MNQVSSAQASDQVIGEHVSQLVRIYLNQLGSSDPKDLYGMVLGEVEVPLLRSVMDYTNNNQSRTARMLGISRGTLRTKLKQYFGDTYIKTRD